MGRLPIGIQSFEKLIEGGFVYADKTSYIWNLVNRGSVYFLSRPRRFGKSLFLSTLQAYFEGKKDLFKGLKIFDLEESNLTPWTEYPVIYLSFASGNYKNPGELTSVINFLLHVNAKKFGVNIEETNSIGTSLYSLIKNVKEKTGKEVVVLIDEYDKPLLDNLATNEQLEDANRDILRSLYGSLKDADEFLHFLFITGVTKFSKISLFSGFNQLNDISLDEEYACICGITEEEMLNTFHSEIKTLADKSGITEEACVDELRKNYDGYYFSAGKIGVYNPFSLLNCFSKFRFGKFWYETGTPTFLVQCLMKYGISLQDFTEGIRATAEEMSEYRVGSESVIPLFYQAGYLSIKDYDDTFGEYTLAFPNHEVEYGFLNSLVPSINSAYIGLTGKFSASRITKFIREGDIESFMLMMKALLASIPYYEGQAPENEQQWRNIIFAVFEILGQYVFAEVHSSAGRSDCIIETDSYIYIFEFKQDKSAEDALQQIEDKGYALPYISSQKKIIKIGANFSSKAGTLDEWKIE